MCASLAQAQTDAQSTYAPIANISPVFIDFGTVNIGVRKTVPVTVRNLSSLPMTFAGGSFDITGVNAGFESNLGTCGSSLAPGAACALNFSFRPRNNLETVQVATSTEAVSAGTRTQPVQLSFVGRGTGNLVIMRPTTIDFGSWLIGSTATVPVVITNPLDIAVNFAGGGINPANGFVGSSGTCENSLPAFTTCQFEYSFVPGQLGPVQNATSIQVTTAAPAVAQHFPIQVSGTGTSSVGVVTVAPVGVGFGRVKIGSQVTVPIRFTNISAVAVEHSGGELPPGSAFWRGAPIGAGCTDTMAVAGTSCATNYTFQPTALGEHTDSAEKIFSRPGASQTQTYQLSGSAVGVVAQVSPVEFDFGDVVIGTSVSLTVTVLNDGNLPLSGFVGGGVSAPFSHTSTCSAPLSPNTACTYTYGFNATPSRIGPHETMTLIAFTNFSGVQATTEIRMRATGVDRLFRNGFE